MWDLPPILVQIVNHEALMGYVRPPLEELSKDATIAALKAVNLLTGPVNTMPETLTSTRAVV